MAHEILIFLDHVSYQVFYRKITVDAEELISDKLKKNFSEVVFFSVKTRVRERRKSKNGSSSSAENQDRSPNTGHASSLSPIQEGMGAETAGKDAARGDSIGLIPAPESSKAPPKFDEEKWKKKTDELVHAICRLIRYPNPQGYHLFCPTLHFPKKD